MQFQDFPGILLLLSDEVAEAQPFVELVYDQTAIGGHPRSLGTRPSLIQERADEANRIQKVLEGGNIKLGSVVSNIRGKSGRHILAAIAVGGCILEIAYFVLRDGVAYQELGVNYYDERKKDAVVRNAVKRLERLGYRVAIEPAA